MRVAVLGAGSWGTTVAAIVSRRNDTVLWARRPEVAEEINTQRSTSYLPGFELPSALRATSEIEHAVKDAEILVVGVPTHGFRDVLVDARRLVAAGIPVVSIAKGFEPGSLLRMTELIGEVVPLCRAAVLTGPNIAKEIMGGQAAAAVVATDDQAVAKGLQEVLGRPDVFRVYRHHDVVGCEVSGALKNVIAIATGIAQGLGVGDNTRAAVIARGLAELTHLGVAMGGEPATFAGLAGLGDLVATCVSPQSRNRFVGEQLGRGRPLAEILAGMTMVAEGVKAAVAVRSLADRFGLRLPICNEIYRVVTGEITAPYAYRGLRPAGHEAELG